MFRQPFLSILAGSLIAALATAQNTGPTDPDRIAKGLESSATATAARVVGLQPDRDAKGIAPDAGAKDPEPGESARRARAVGLEADRDGKGLEPDAKVKDLDPDARSKDLEPDRGAKGLEPAESSARRARAVGLEGDRGGKGLDPDAGSKGLDPDASGKDLDPDAGAKDPDPLGAADKGLDPDRDAKGIDNSRNVYQIFDGEQLRACVTVDAYGQRSAGEDMSRYGKVLKLSFRMANDRIGKLEIAGGLPNRAFGVVLGMARAEHRLPWGDTVLVSSIINVASGTFAGDGKGTLILDMALTALPLIETNIYVQAFAMLDRPVSSHGLHFSVCGANRAKDTFGLEPSSIRGELRNVKDLDELRKTFGLDADRKVVDVDRGDLTGKRVGSVGTDAYSTYPFETRLVMTSGDARYWLAAWVTVPTTGFELRHDKTFVRAGEIHVLFSVVAPAASERVAQVFETHHKMVEIPAIEGKRVLVFVADRVRGSNTDSGYMIGGAF